MPRASSIQMIDPTRAAFSGVLSAEELRALAEDPRVRILQCSAPVPESVWPLINDTLLVRRPDIIVRLYGFYGLRCDLSVLRHLPAVRGLSVDCLGSADHLDAITSLPHLEGLDIGVFSLDSFSVLEGVPASLKNLGLSATQKRGLSLAPLGRFTGLTSLYLEGHHKSIEVLAALRTLEKVTLRSISTPDLSYLAPLQRIWSLDLKLGGIRSFRGIEGKTSLKYLELWQIRGLADIGVISTLTGLQYLFLQSLPHVTAIPSLRGNAHLRRIYIENLKGLKDLSELEWAPALEEFMLSMGQKQTLEQLAPMLRNPSVKRVSARFGSNARNRRFDETRAAANKGEVTNFFSFDYR